MRADFSLCSRDFQIIYEALALQIKHTFSFVARTLSLPFSCMTRGTRGLFVSFNDTFKHVSFACSIRNEKCILFHLVCLLVGRDHCPLPASPDHVRRGPGVLLQLRLAAGLNFRARRTPPTGWCQRRSTPWQQICPPPAGVGWLVGHHLTWPKSAWELDQGLALMAPQSQKCPFLGTFCPRPWAPTPLWGVVPVPRRSGHS